MKKEKNAKPKNQNIKLVMPVNMLQKYQRQQIKTQKVKKKHKNKEEKINIKQQKH